MPSYVNLLSFALIDFMWRNGTVISLAMKMPVSASRSFNQLFEKKKSRKGKWIKKFPYYGR
jgi:hypothetical protein